MAGDVTLAQGKKLEEQDDGTYAEVFALANQRGLLELLREQNHLLQQIRHGIGLLVGEDLSKLDV